MPAPLFHGCAVALITPFRNGEIDFDALRRLVDFQLQNGTDAIVACGTTGEPSTMTADEWERTLACVVESVGGRVPVIAGTGGNCTADVIGKARVARAIGADAQLCVTPYYNKTTQAGLIAHYTAVADDGALPLMVYNVPARTGLNLLPETLAALAGHERIIAVKEASGDVAQIADMLALCGDQIVCYSGSDELTVPVRALGGSGVISVAANIAPALMCEMTHLPLEQAAKLNLRAMPLFRALFSEVNPIPVKAALAKMGYGTNTLRLPLTPMDEGKKAVLFKSLEGWGV